MIWPVLLLLGNECRRRTDVVIVTVLACSFLISVTAAQHDQPAAFYSPLCRLWELAAGGLLAQLELKRRREDRQTPRQPWRAHRITTGASYVGLALILGAGCLYRGFQHFPGYLALAPVLGAGLILAAGAESTPNRRFLASGPMVYLGRLSYCLYLWHWPVLVLADLIFHHKQDLLSNSGCLLVTCALSLMTFYVCEQPIRTIPVHSGNTWKYLAAGTASAAGIAAVALLILSERFVRASDAKLITGTYHRSVIGCMFRGLNAAEAKPPTFAPCEAIQFPKRPVVILVGDSHANALYGGLKPYLDARRVNLIEYAVTNCMPLTTMGSFRGLRCDVPIHFGKNSTNRSRPGRPVRLSPRLEQRTAIRLSTSGDPEHVCTASQWRPPCIDRGSGADLGRPATFDFEPRISSLGPGRTGAYVHRLGDRI